MTENVWQMLMSSLSVCQEFWYRTMVIHWSRFRRGVILYGREQSTRNFGIISRTRCWWNSPKANVQIFRATTPLCRGQLRRKGHGKLSIYFAADQEQLKLFFEYLFLRISSVFTEQLRTYVKHMNPITIDQDDSESDGTINCAQ